MSELIDDLPPLVSPDEEEQWTEVMGDAIAMWMQNSSSFFQEQKRKVKVIALGPFLFGVTEYLPKVWQEILISSGLIERNRLQNLGPLNEEEHVTLSLTEQLLERCMQLMTIKGDLKTILNFIHDVEERTSSKEGDIDLSFAQRELFAMHIFTSMWASIRRIYEKKKKSLAGACVIYLFKIIHQQVLHYGLYGSDKIDITKEQILHRMYKSGAPSANQEISADGYCNSANRAFKQKDYNQAISDYTQAILRNPFDSKFMSNRSQAHLHLKKFREAFWDCKRAIILDPNNSKNYYRCARACIEFGWLEDAKEMNERSLDNSHTEEEKSVILKQAHTIEEKKEEMKSKKEEKAPDGEVMYTCTDSINFRKLLSNGYNQFQRRQYHQSAETFQQALDYISDLGVERLRIEEEEVLVITYVLGKALVETGTGHNLLTSIEKFSSILAVENKNFPVAYYGMVQAYFHLNRFKEAATYGHRGLEVLQSQDQLDKDRIHLWPTSDSAIEETEYPELKKRLKDLLQECKFSPKPDAICRVHTDLENLRREIYFSDPDYKGFVKLTCRHHCFLDFHISCWKAFKSSLSEKHSDKTMIDTKCPTPDCGGTINTITIFRTAKEEPVQFTSTMKGDAKPVRPWIKQKVIDPAKLQRKEDQKKQRKQRKTEAIERKRKEREREEQEQAQNESMAALTATGDSKTAETQEVYKGEVTVLLKDDTEVLLEGKQKSTKNKKKKEKSKQLLALDVQFAGDEEKVLVSASDMDSDGDFLSKGSGLLPNPGSGIWPIGNGLLPVPSSIPIPDDMALNLYEFFADFLKNNGPQEVDSPLLRGWISDFPKEVTQKIAAYGGLENFIYANKRFTVISGRILCNIEDQDKAMAMAGEGAKVKPAVGQFPWAKLPNPALSMTESAKLQNKNQSPAAFTPPSVSTASSIMTPWNTQLLTAKLNKREVDASASSTASSSSLPEARSDLTPISLFDSPGKPDDGFTTVGKKKFKGNNHEASSTGTATMFNSTTIQNHPVSALKYRGAHYLTRAEEAAKLDLFMEDNGSDKIQESSAPPGSVVRLVSDDNSDVTTHSSDSMSVMEMIEELNSSSADFPSANGSSSSVGSEPQHENGLFTDKLSFNSTSQTMHPAFGGSSVFQPKSSSGSSNPVSALSSIIDPTTGPGSRRDSDASIRSDDIQRSSSPASQGSSGSSHSQPAPLKPLKMLAGIRRGKMKAPREGHTSKSDLSISSKASTELSKDEQEPHIESAFNIEKFNSNVLSDPKSLRETAGESKNSDLEAFIMKEIIKSQEKGQVLNKGQTKSSSQDLDKTTSLNPTLMKSVATSKPRSIWEPVGSQGVDYVKLKPDPDISTDGAKFVTEDFANEDLHSLKKIWKMDNSEATKNIGNKLFAASDLFRQSNSPAADPEPPSYFMPSFNDMSNFSKISDIGKNEDRESLLQSSTDMPWPIISSPQKNIEAKLSVNSFSATGISEQPSIWGPIHKPASNSSQSKATSPSFLFKSTDSENPYHPSASSFQPFQSVIPSSEESDSTSSSMKTKASSLNPFSKVFIPSQNLTKDGTLAGKGVLDVSSDSSKSSYITTGITVNTNEQDTQTRRVETSSTSANTIMTHTQIAKLLSDFERTIHVIKSLKTDLKMEQEEKKKLLTLMEEKDKKLEEHKTALEKMGQENTRIEKCSQDSEVKVSEMEKQVERERKRALDAEKKILNMMSQILAQKLKAKKLEGQKHMQQLTQAQESLKAKNIPPHPAIMSKSQEWQVFDAQCEYQLNNLSTLYTRYTDFLDKGITLEDLPDITATVVSPEMPKPPSWDDFKGTLGSTATSQEAPVLPTMRSTEQPPQSTMLKPIRMPLPNPVSELKMSAQAQGSTNPPGFKRIAPLTFPLRQRVPKTNSLASKLATKPQTPSAPYEQIMTDMQSSFPNLSREAITRMIEDLRHAKGGRLNHMNVREMCDEISSIVMGRTDHKIAAGEESSLGDVIHISRSNSEEDLCPICHEELSCMETQILQCGHKFHDQCIKEWFDRQHSCPVCRVHSFLPEEFPSLR